MVERLAAEQRSRKDQRVEGSENDDDDEDDHGGGEAADGGLGLGDHFQVCRVDLRIGRYS